MMQRLSRLNSISYIATRVYGLRVVAATINRNYINFHSSLLTDDDAKELKEFQKRKQREIDDARLKSEAILKAKLEGTYVEPEITELSEEEKAEQKTNKFIDDLYRNKIKICGETWCNEVIRTMNLRMSDESVIYKMMDGVNECCLNDEQVPKRLRSAGFGSVLSQVISTHKKNEQIMYTVMNLLINAKGATRDIFDELSQPFYDEEKNPLLDILLKVLRASDNQIAREKAGIVVRKFALYSEPLRVRLNELGFPKAVEDVRHAVVMDAYNTPIDLNKEMEETLRCLKFGAALTPKKSREDRKLEKKRLQAAEVTRAANRAISTANSTFSTTANSTSAQSTQFTSKIPSQSTESSHQSHTTNTPPAQNDETETPVVPAKPGKVSWDTVSAKPYGKPRAKPAWGKETWEKMDEVEEKRSDKKPFDNRNRVNSNNSNNSNNTGDNSNNVRSSNRTNNDRTNERSNDRTDDKYRNKSNTTASTDFHKAGRDTASDRKDTSTSKPYKSSGYKPTGSYNTSTSTSGSTAGSRQSSSGSNGEKKTKIPNYTEKSK